LYLKILSDNISKVSSMLKDIVACYGTWPLLWRVMPLKTPFCLVNSFYYSLTVRNYNYFLHYYTFTQLHSNLFTLLRVYTITLQSLHAIRSSFPLFNLTLHLHKFTLWNLPANCCRRIRLETALLAAMISRITSRHRPHRKQSLPHIVAKECLLCHY
jgi:hypothetical protein